MVVKADLLQSNISLRSATPTPKAQPEVSMARIPIHRNDGLPIVTVTIDGEQCNMFFDTGAPGVVLNSKYFDHNIDGEVMGSGGRGAVGTGSVSGLHHVKSIDMGGITLHETDIMTSDLSNLETIGMAVHGIIQVRQMEIIHILRTRWFVLSICHAVKRKTSVHSTRAYGATDRRTSPW